MFGLDIADQRTYLCKEEARDKYKIDDVSITVNNIMPPLICILSNHNHNYANDIYCDDSLSKHYLVIITILPGNMHSLDRRLVYYNRSSVAHHVPIISIKL